MSEEAEILLKAKFENGQLVVDTTKKINQNLKDMGDAAQDAGKKSETLFNSLKKIVAVVGIAKLANEFKDLVAGSLKAAGSMEQVNVALTTMLGSADKAKELTEQLIAFAKTTPFQIEGIFDTTKQLLALGIAQDQIIPTMSMLGNIASGLNVPMDRLALVYGQVRAAGHLMGQDLNQFTQAGVPMIAELAKVLGVAESQVRKLGESGSISFANVQQALSNMTSEGGRFFNLMEMQSKTFLGTVSNMSDSFFQVRNALGNALLPVAKEVVAWMIDGMQKLKLVIENNKESITKFAQGVVTAFSLIGKAFGLAWDFLMNFVNGIKVLLSIPLVGALVGAATAVLTLSKGIGILTVAFRILTTTAFGWISAIVLATTAIGYFSKGVDNMPNFIKIGMLQTLKMFELLKLGIFDFVQSVLDKLSLLEKLPGFGWIEDSKKKMEDLKKTSIDSIGAISKEIENLKSAKVDVSANVAAKTDLPPATQQLKIEQSAPAEVDANKEENKRLKALKEENSALLEEQKNFLAGYGLNETEADKLLADNKTLSMQQKLLQDSAYKDQKEALDMRLLNNEITNEGYKRELATINNQAKLEALQIQYDEELVKFQENQLLMDETKSQMQSTQDGLELGRLQLKLSQEESVKQSSIQKMATFKTQMDIKTFEEEKSLKVKQLQNTIKMDTDGFKAAQGAANELVALQNSKNKSLAAIGKAAAIFQITNDTARGAIAAYASLAPLPVVGPVLGAAAAAAIIAYGAERLSSVSSNSFAVGTPNVPEDQLANIHKGEMIVPATFSEAIRSGDLTLGSSDATGSGQSSAAITNININFEGAQFIGQLDNDDIIMIGERIGQLVAENIIPAIPTRTA